MIRYFKYKRAKWKVEGQIYEMIGSLLDNQKDIVNLAQRLFVTLKDVPNEELQKEFISALATVVHESNNEDTK
jgi:hypothetical protein